MAGEIPQLEGPQGAAVRAATAAWRRTVPSGETTDVLLAHGLRLARLVGGEPRASGPTAGRAPAVAAVLHEVGFFVADRGHFAVRGARWTSIHLDEVLTDPTADERLLVGELILFHRHRGPLPAGVAWPDLVDRFRQLESWDRLGGAPPEDAASAESAGGGRLRRALRRLEWNERLRHPLVSRRITRIRRPDR